MKKAVAIAFAAFGVVASVAWAEGSGESTRRNSGIVVPQPAGAYDAGEDSSAPPPDGGAAADTTCNFVGIPCSDLVNNAYAGGVSSSGAARKNLGVRFTGAQVLCTWNGCCSPDANIAYAPNGSILLASTAATANWGGVNFSSSNSVALSVAGFASVDGTGPAVQTVTIPANVSTTYNTWTSRQVTFTQAVRSIVISGTANRWGIDTVSPIIAPPIINSVSPNSGTQFGGTTITLTGIGLNTATGVTVGGLAATNLTVLSSTQITAITPFSPTSGAKDVRVTTPVGSYTLVNGFTYLAASPALTITSNAQSCTPLNTTVAMDVTLSGVVSNVNSGQIALSWDPTKLQPAATNPIQAGDSPFTIFYNINSSAGNALILVSIAPGSAGAPVQSKVVAKLRFNTVGVACNGSGTSVGFLPNGNLPTQFTDGVGGSIFPQLVPSATFVVDNGAPVLTNVPANRTVSADAGSGNFAVLNPPLAQPTVTDDCSPTTLTFTRSDGQTTLTAAYPVGTTTVTWRAQDPCGNATTATTTITVLPLNTMTFTASWVSPFGGGAGAVRPVSLVIGSLSRSVNASVAGNGNASFSVTDLPAGTYSCATVEDATRSLRRRVTVTDGGTTWTAANAVLVLGDVINDEVIDVLDWGAYVATNPNADLNSDGSVNATDGNIILANFGLRGDSPCGSGFVDAPQPVVSITVAALHEMGLGELVVADINRDGVLDATDIELYTGNSGNAD